MTKKYSIPGRNKGHAPRFNMNRPPIRVINRKQILFYKRDLALDAMDTGSKEKKQKSYKLFNEVPYLAEEKPVYKSRGTHKGKYLDPRTDFGFKTIFKNEFLLRSFINPVLEEIMEEGTKVGEVQYTSTEALGRTKEERMAFFDLTFINETKERFLLEMQDQPQDDFMGRSHYYSTYLLREQAFKGERVFHFKRVYMIGILNFNLDEEDPCFRKSEITENFFLKNTCCETTFIYLQLPKFNKKEHELKTILDKWLYVLKNIHWLTKRPAILFEEEFKLLFELARVANLTPQEMDLYERSLKAKTDIENKVKYGRREGRREGGRKKELEIAKNLKYNGAPPEMIEKCTGLTLEQILKL